MSLGEPSINFPCQVRWSCHISGTLSGTKWNNADIMVHCNNQVPYHLQSILANQSASASTRLIILFWISHCEAPTPFLPHSTSPHPPPSVTSVISTEDKSMDSGITAHYSVDTIGWHATPEIDGVMLQRSQAPTPPVPDQTKVTGQRHVALSGSKTLRCIEEWRGEFDASTFFFFFFLSQQIHILRHFNLQYLHSGFETHIKRDITDKKKNPVNGNT